MQPVVFLTTFLLLATQALAAANPDCADKINGENCFYYSTEEVRVVPETPSIAQEPADMRRSNKASTPPAAMASVRPRSVGSRGGARSRGGERAEVDGDASRLRMDPSRSSRFLRLRFSLLLRQELLPRSEVE
ncbi:hypothetical protein Tdes44962_MAKER07661 [Teratosphaeria destructans]|uniref:Uncharacterized protein n=1 Tax=Teratosphaeria destructans TaxID=418781 RepID=A0A9W7W600_9PEZI|nr:hypothetical protein Tdes44962_MAKER07661 [Teratosphaeria destructans]